MEYPVRVAEAPPLQVQCPLVVVQLADDGDLHEELLSELDYGFLACFFLVCRVKTSESSCRSVRPYYRVSVVTGCHTETRNDPARGRTLTDGAAGTGPETTGG